MSDSYLIIETINPHMGVIKKIIPIKEAIRLHIAKDGKIEIIKEENKCKTCGGKGGITYFWAQDDSKSFNCPICNHGNQERWDKAKLDWEKYR